VPLDVLRAADFYRRGCEGGLQSSCAARARLTAK
jgi:hypothetical protein